MLGITAKQAECAVSQLSERRIIQKEANNVAENGPGKKKWVRGGIPTRLELIDQLTTLKGIVTLHRSQEAVSQRSECSIDDADHLLYDLRDRNILILTCDVLTRQWRWCRPSDVVNHGHTAGRTGRRRDCYACADCRSRRTSRAALP